MSFVTQGKIKVSLGIETKVKVSPTNEYRVTHRKVNYTVFMNDSESRCFKEDDDFAVHESIQPYLVQLAVKDICLEITIEYANVKEKRTEEEKPSSKMTYRITQIQVPA